MQIPQTFRPGKSTGRNPSSLLSLAAAVLLTGCALVSTDEALTPARQQTEREFGVRLDATGSIAEREDTVRKLLAEPLDGDAAARLALLNSPALRAAMADSVAAQNRAAQNGQPLNPRFSFERATRGDELEITRALTFGLTDLLTWPARRGIAREQLMAERWRLASDVLRTGHDARMAWVRAVAAEQRRQYQQQVLDAAQASAELARRMQSVGNFSRLQRSREQAFEADARLALTRAQVEATASREAMVRLLGLKDAEAQQLKLPDRLPDLPGEPRAVDAAREASAEQRLDLQIAQARWRLARQSSGTTRWTSWTDVELTGFRTRESGVPAQRGWELEIALPLFDLGDAQRAAASHEERAAIALLEQAQLEAGSLLRERYTAYRSAYDLARQHRDELVPLRRAIAEDMLLNYNGMLIGVFELLADARAQIGSVIAALDAQRDFWLADAALQSAIRGVPTAGVSLGDGPATPAPSEGGH
jgi:outer membrane protein TolC